MPGFKEGSAVDTNSQVSPVTSQTTQLYSANSNVMGKEDFLKLLVTQLKNQDPLSPMDNTEFVSQLAQFSSLEQLTNINENLKLLQLYQNSINNSEAVGLIGKNVLSNGNTTRLQAGADSQITFALPKAASAVSIDIYDAAGNFVNTLTSGALPAGEQTASWNGKDAKGTRMPPGIYTFKVQAEDENGTPIDTGNFSEGVVTGVRFDNGSPYLMTGEDLIPLAAVQKVTDAEAAAGESEEPPPEESGE